MDLHIIVHVRRLNRLTRRIVWRDGHVATDFINLDHDTAQALRIMREAFILRMREARATHGAGVAAIDVWHAWHVALDHFWSALESEAAT